MNEEWFLVDKRWILGMVAGLCVR